jgi:hypothetical protein
MKSQNELANLVPKSVAQTRAASVEILKTSKVDGIGR